LFKYDSCIYRDYGSTALTAAPCDTSYTVTAYTNNFPDAGFDGNIFVTMKVQAGTAILHAEACQTW
jgi:hypothetical protein